MKPILAAIVLFFAMIAYRLVVGMSASDLPWAVNFAPLAALVLCGPLLFPRRIAVVLPFAILLVSDLILNAHHGAPLVNGWMLGHYLALVPVALLGLRLSGNRRALPWLGACLAGSILFYLFTNTVSWLADPAYGKSAAGWLQALTVGLPGLPPTWIFFRNSLLSDLLFTSVILLCVLPRPASNPSTASVLTR